MPDTPMMPADPAQPDQAAQAPQPVKTICIDVMADGTFMVGTEEPEAGAMPGMGAEMGGEGAEPAEETMKPAASLDEALEMARGLLQNDGRSPEEQAMAGYSKGAGNPMAAKMSPAKVFGD